jgi:DNA-binding ferritin-like protein (Dps family)
LAEAVQSGAKAQKISFEFQQRLAEISKYLFNLGVSNIVANNTVVRDLEMRMRGASEKELSELARQELTAVVKRLKEQQDILHKQAKTTAILEEHDSDIKNALQQAGDLKQIIANQSTQQAKLDSRQDKVISSLEDRAKAKEKLDASQDEFLKSLSAELSLLRDRLTTTENALQASQNASAALGKAHGSMRTITMAALAMSVSCLLAVAWLLLSH